MGSASHASANIRVSPHAPSIGAKHFDIHFVSAGHVEELFDLCDCRCRGRRRGIRV
jgi:hypothetical protein